MVLLWIINGGSFCPHEPFSCFGSSITLLSLITALSTAMLILSWAGVAWDTELVIQIILIQKGPSLLVFNTEQKWKAFRAALTNVSLHMTWHTVVLFYIIIQLSFDKKNISVQLNCIGLFGLCGMIKSLYYCCMCNFISMYTIWPKASAHLTRCAWWTTHSKIMHITMEVDPPLQLYQLPLPWEGLPQDFGLLLLDCENVSISDKRQEVRLWCWTRRPGSQSAFEFLPKGFIGVEVTALRWPVEFVHTKPNLKCLCIL